jgi:exopolysaccharide biosynthesis polyprenyl glycosylphosphotransferase
MNNPHGTLDWVCERRWYRLLTAVCDIAGLALAWHASFHLRLVLNPVMHRNFSAEKLETLAIPLANVMLVWAVTAGLLGLYRGRSSASLGQNLLRVTQSVGVFCAAIIVYAFFRYNQGLSRSFILLFAAVSFCVLLLCHYMLLLAFFIVRDRWVQKERILVAGDADSAEQVVSGILAEGNPFCEVVGITVPERCAAAAAAHGSEGIAVQGTLTQLAQIINREAVSRVIIANGSLSRDDFEECIRISSSMGVTASHALTTSLHNVQCAVRIRYGMPVVDMRPVKFTRNQEIVKRASDLIIGILSLIACSPIMILSALAIKLTSPGPVFYRSQRVGKGGRHFDFLKFRSMRTDTGRQRVVHANEKSGHLFKIKRDPRVTPFGRFMRRYSIDELPQLINVIRGDMSLVGPRPLPAEDLDLDGQSRQFGTWARQRSSVVPGITGLWQVRGRSDLPFEQMAELDIAYIRNWSLGLDLRVLLVTPIAVITGKGAY